VAQAAGHAHPLGAGAGDLGLCGIRNSFPHARRGHSAAGNRGESAGYQRVCPEPDASDSPACRHFAPKLTSALTVRRRGARAGV